MSIERRRENEVNEFVELMPKALKYAIPIIILIWSALYIFLTLAPEDIKKHAITIWLIALIIIPLSGGLIARHFARQILRTMHKK